jgi:glycosyltransferase involved in cell wall biosynthesis
MSDKPILSIIVPVYNAQDRIKKCVDSILGQEYQDYELILVNDGSKDDSLSICLDYVKSDDRIVVIDKENSGAGETRNAGIDAARGEYIVFIDSDDTVESCMLDTLLHLIKMDSEIDLVCCNHSIESAVSGNKTNNKKMNIPKDNWITADKAEALYIMEETRSFCYLWNKIFKRCFIEKNHIRFEKQFITGQDLDFVIKYYYHVRSLAITNEPLYNYYKYGVGSLCARYKPGLYEMVTELSDRRYRLFCDLGMDKNSQYMELYGRSHIEYIHSCIPNLFRKNAKLNKKEKKEILGKVFADNGLKKYMPTYAPEDKLGKLFLRLYQKGSVNHAYHVYFLLFLIRNNMNWLYALLRK